MVEDAGASTQLLGAGRELRFPRFRIAVLEGPDRGRSIEGGAEEIAIGTGEANDLVLRDPAVSRHHIAITTGPRGLLVSDLGSTNGTTLNSVLIERAYIPDGAVIAIGNTRLRCERIHGDEAAPLSNEHRWGRALGASTAMRRLFAVLPRLAESDSTVLLEGETGTGKSLLAAALHEQSPRAKGPLVVVDCGAIPPNLIESELFGHEKGAFTGATAVRVGAFEAARGGTVFLDEIGELPIELQPKLLRVLDAREVKRVGGTTSIPLELRVIAATNRDLRSEINRGQFRPDLYYRLNTIKLRVPPLRERREDIAMLAAHFYSQFSASGEAPPAELLTELVRHDWPGNVRELRAAIERIVLLGDPDVWRELSDEGPGLDTGAVTLEEGVSFRVAKERAVADWERRYVRALVDSHGGNLSRAARAVRMDRNHLRELLVRHRVRTDEPE